MNGNQIKQFIIDNKSDCVLLIGNGINRYKCNGHKGNDCSWDKLLKDLAKKYCPSVDLSLFQKEASNTEIFDLLQISFLREIPESKIGEYEPSISNLNFPKDFSERIQELASNYNYSPFSLKDVCLKNALESYKAMAKSITSDDTDMALILASYDGNRVREIIQDNLIKDICTKMKKWSFSSIHQEVTYFAKAHGLPILTTNYDTLLEEAVNAEEYDWKHISASESFPISLCYTTDSHKPDFNKFNIWHINGVVNYPKSILIGLTHYMRSIENIRDLLFSPNKLNIEIIQNKDIYTLKNTWIHLIFSKHLVIFGLSLDRDEVLLRWLLIERAKLFALNPFLAKKGYYIIPKSEKMKKGKKLFFQMVGLKVIQVKDYDVLYKIVTA